MDELVEKVLRIAALVEDRDDALAFRLSRLARTLSAAKQTDVKLDSWDDFAAWWNQNRSQGLLFSLVDALGSDNPIIGQMKTVMAQQDQLEAKLHDIYLQLKGQQGTLPAPAATETEPMPAPVEAPALDEGVGEGNGDLDALLDETTEASVRKIQPRQRRHVAMSALVALLRPQFTAAALENISETSPNIVEDVQSLVNGTFTPETLLAHCLNGADDDRVQGWHDYVEVIDRASHRADIESLLAREAELTEADIDDLEEAEGAADKMVFEDEA